ncbi:MAG: hypothetical protein NXI02_24265 [Rhodobacteraceae bacterium]|nr:hypothetical protein [Paracoccaceae bacterium]
MAALTSPDMAVANGHVRLITLRQITPRRSCAQDMEDAVENLPVLFAGQALSDEVEVGQLPILRR